MNIQRIRFQDDDNLLLIGGVITTEEQFRRGFPGYAYLYDDGIIRRHGKQIGTKDDLVILDEVDIRLSLDESAEMLENMIFGTWYGR